MELVKDIYFNTDKLVENTNVKVSYTGKFYQGNNEKVFIHYGYGKDWNNVNEIEMKKTDLGYQTELCLIGGDTLNFCFKNQNNEWDNNCGKNYVFNIEKAPANACCKTIEGTKDDGIVFFGKTYNKNNGVEGCSNVYWTSEDAKKVGIIKPNIGGEVVSPVNTITADETTISKSVDTVIQNNTGNVSKCDVISPVANCGSASGINGVNGFTNNITLDTNVNIKNNVGEGYIKVPNTIATNIINPIKNNQQTAIALAPTGFNYWTKRIKETVRNFFAYVPKLISGNYKGNIFNNTNNNTKK